MKNVLKKILCVALSCLLLVGTVAVASADEVRRVSCSMYADGATGRGFCWFTAEKSASDLQIVAKADFTSDFANARTYTGKATLYRQQYSHKVSVTDLAPGTEYFYRVGDAEKGMWSNVCSFVTDDRDDSFSFITLADVQASSDENFAHAALTMKAAMETLPAAEFNVNLGDYVNDNTNEEWDWFFKNFAFANESMTHVPVAGNHDGNITNKLNTFCFQNTFCLDESVNRSTEGVYYSFDYGNAHFAVLNTNDMYPMSQAQRNWLVNDMSASHAMWKIVLMHRASYSAGKNINKPDTIIMREVLMPLFDCLDIDMAYAGHDHMYLRTTQVYKDKAVADVEYVTESYKGEQTTFAVDPEGTVYVIPSTAGTKRYNVNENAIKPILDVADVYFSTKSEYENGGGCFCTTEIDGGRLIYKAYVVNDETQAVKLVDTYAISKSAPGETKDIRLDQSLVSTVLAWFADFVIAFSGMMLEYVKLLFQVIAK